MLHVSRNSIAIKGGYTHMKMKKFINNPENLTTEALDGLAAAHKDIIYRGEGRSEERV